MIALYPILFYFNFDPFLFFKFNLILWFSLKKQVNNKLRSRKPARLILKFIFNAFIQLRSEALSQLASLVNYTSLFLFFFFFLLQIQLSYSPALISLNGCQFCGYCLPVYFIWLSQLNSAQLSSAQLSFYPLLCMSFILLILSKPTLTTGKQMDKHNSFILTVSGDHFESIECSCSFTKTGIAFQLFWFI